MGTLTAGWTDRHSAVALTLTFSIVAQLVALVEGEPLTWWVAGAVGAAAVVSLAFDAWAGALVGLAAAVALVAVRRLTHHWTADDFWPATLETMVCVVVGGCAGAAGRRLRQREEATGGSSVFEPVHGSLGLVGSEAAMGRLEEELARGRRLERPVALVLLDVTVTDPDLTPEARSAALRAVARIIESRAQEQDVPFATAEDRFGVICPETTPSIVWDVVGRMLESVSTASFTFGVERQSRALVDAVSVSVGIAHQSLRDGTPEDLLDEAEVALARARRGEVTS